MERRLKVELFLREHKGLMRILIFLALALLLYCLSYIQLGNMALSPSMVSIAATLFGAIIGGAFTLAGTVAVSKQQAKAQNFIRRKNLIYKPLYDELQNIHTNILGENPFPLFVEFQKGPQTILPHPQYSAWERIKSDSRFLETPDALIKCMDELYSRIHAYQRARAALNDDIKQALNLSLEIHLGCTCSISNIGDVLAPYVLKGEKFDLFKEIQYAIPCGDDVNKDIMDMVYDTFYEQCNMNEHVSDARNKHELWMNVERRAIDLLSLLIKYINVKYEG